TAELRTRIRFDPTGARFRQTRIAFGRSAITVDAHLRLSGDFEVHGRGERVELDDIDPLAGFDIGGHGDLRFDTEGRYSDPLVTGHTRLAAFRFHQYEFGDVE